MMNPNMFGTNVGTKRPLFGEEPDNNQGWAMGNQQMGMGAGAIGQQQGENGGTDRKRKRKSRWNTGNDEKTVIPGMPTVIPSDLSETQQRQYVVQLQIEEVTRKLRTGELGIPSNPEQRSPSPEPIYNNEGKRLNTREYRTRKKLEEERHKLIQEAMKLNTEFKPPSDYKPPIVRVNDKVMIPQEDHPEINFVGLLIGPRGNTLKTLEKDTGAKIIIRGKGSVKDGKIGRKDGQPLPGEDEPLHAYVTANIQKCQEGSGTEIIKQGIEVPEGQNDLRRQQLRELALLNGTLRENDGLQKLRQIAESQTIVTNTIICTICGGTGHIAQDCKQKRPGDTFRMQQMQNPADRAKMDSEYMSLMAELGEGPPPPPKSDSHGPPPPNSFGQNQPPFSRPLLSNPPPNPMAVNSPWQIPPGNRPPMANPVPPPPSSSGPPLLNRPPMGLQSQSPQINPMGRLPMPLMSNAPPGQAPPPPGMQQGPPPPSMLNLGHPGQQQQQPPQQMGNMQQPPPPQQPQQMQHQQQQQSLRPWQQPISQAQPVMNQGGASSSASMGIPPPPPSMMSAPPPPPASTQGHQVQQTPPWMQQQPGNMGLQQQQQQQPPPPPPPTSTAPWQQQQQQQPPQQNHHHHQQQQQHNQPGMGAPPPPPVSTMAPWQHPPPPQMSGGAPPPPPGHHNQFQQQQQHPHSMMGAGAGPVPPPSSMAGGGGSGPPQQFNNYGAPPPPPPMNFNNSNNQRMGMMMPVPPPPPPPSN